MSSATSQPPSSSINDAERLESLYRNLAIGGIIACPILLALPPRKLDTYTVALIGGTFVSSNYLAQVYSGRSILTRFQDRAASLTSSRLPPKAQEMQTRLREERLRRDNIIMPAQEEKVSVLEELSKQEKSEKERGILEKVWMGSEGDDWKAKRDKREKEALEEGKGYGDLIMDQIWEVWNWGKDKNEEVREIDEKVVEARKNGKN